LSVTKSTRVNICVFPYIQKWCLPVSFSFFCSCFYIMSIYLLGLSYQSVHWLPLFPLFPSFVWLLWSCSHWVSMDYTCWLYTFWM
jgi:hypothetical protein